MNMRNVVKFFINKSCFNIKLPPPPTTTTTTIKHTNVFHIDFPCNLRNTSTVEVDDSLHVDMWGNKLLDLKIETIRLNMNTSIWVSSYFCFTNWLQIKMALICTIKSNRSLRKINYWKKHLRSTLTFFTTISWIAGRTSTHTWCYTGPTMLAITNC